jgi:cbb3-type cytochrome oxidase subunit 1
MTDQQTYNYKVVRQFAIMTIVWGIVGMLVGVLIAAQLAWPVLNFDIPWLTFGRLRPLHTNAVIFAFGGSALFATSYYVVQRTCHVRLISDKLAAFTFWGWQLVIVSAVATLPLGITQSKEYANRHPDYTCVGVLCRRVFWYHRQTQGGAYLCRQLVLRRLYPHHCNVAPRQQCRSPGIPV